MRVKALQDHINDYPLSADRPSNFAVREKKKGDEYEIPNEFEAKVLIEAGVVEEAKKTKA